MRQQKPDLGEIMIKLNDGVSGEGNAVIDISALPAPGSPGEHDALVGRIRSMQLECPGATHDAYLASLAQHGGVVEERVTGEEIHSPSVQLRVTPLGEVELLSTHDQLLGGTTGQSYLGCQFPANAGYAKTIGQESMKVAERLAKEGVVGRFAVDFLAVRPANGEWETYAIELNLRKGGTTHPFLTLQFLAGGSYDPQRAVFETPAGQEKHYIASDHLESPRYRALSPQDVFAIVARHGLHFDEDRQTGAVFHMMATLAENGRIGVTAVGNSKRQAEQLFERIRVVLDEEVSRAVAPLTLPAA